MTHYTNKCAKNHDMLTHVPPSHSSSMEKHLMKTKWLAAFFRRLEFISWAATQTACSFSLHGGRPHLQRGNSVRPNILSRIIVLHSVHTVCNVMWCSSFSINIEIFKHSTGNFCIHKNSFPPFVRIPISFLFLSLALVENRQKERIEQREKKTHQLGR